MRAIDADALDARAFGNEHPYFFDGDDVAKWYKECIKSAPTIEPPASWTPCSVGLPEADGVYDATFTKPDGERGDAALYFCAETKTWGTITCNVIAWKPHSEPYRGEE